MKKQANKAPEPTATALSVSALFGYLVVSFAVGDCFPSPWLSFSLAVTSLAPVARCQHPFGQLHFAAARGADVFVFALHRHSKMDVPAGRSFIRQRATWLGFGIVHLAERIWQLASTSQTMYRKPQNLESRRGIRFTPASKLWVSFDRFRSVTVYFVPWLWLNPRRFWTLMNFIFLSVFRSLPGFAGAIVGFFRHP